MVVIEIIMVVIGLAAVIFSFRISDNSTQSTPAAQSLEKSIDFEKEEKKLLQKLEKSITDKAEHVLDDTDDKLSKISNDKIMGLSEYSEQVFDKMEKNHSEAVFLYNMLNEKKKEIEELVHEVDVVKADVRDEAAREFREAKSKKEEKKPVDSESMFENFAAEMESMQNTEADELKNQTEAADSSLEAEIIAENAKEEKLDLKNDAAPQNKEKKTEHHNNRNKNKKKSSKRKNSSNHQKPTAEQADTKTEDDYLQAFKEELSAEEQHSLADDNAEISQDDMKKRNDEIIELFNKGCSIMEISKMYSMGQGEVKFILDIYK